MYRNTYAEINENHFRHNLKTLMAMVPAQAFFCPMLKSNAYGHGDIELAQIMESENLENLGVALVEEGIRLREAGIKKLNIFIFGPFSEGTEIVQEYKLIPVVSTVEQLKELAAKKGEALLTIHLKFNTGMNRLGLDEADIKEVQNILQENSSLQLEGLCTHLASAEDYLCKEYTDYQLAKFAKFVKYFKQPGLRLHVFNSAGMIARHITREHENFGARPGISLYGVKPNLQNLSTQQQSQWEMLDLKPVMTLKSEIITYHQLAKGDRVSYGGTWVAPRKSVIGVVPIGYADGYHRLFSNRGQLLFRGQKVSVVGRVCMDYILVDLTEVLIDKVGQIGEQVVLFGRQQDNEIMVTQLAKLAETISYELLAGIGRRVPRKFV